MAETKPDERTLVVTGSQDKATAAAGGEQKFVEKMVKKSSVETTQAECPSNEQEEKRDNKSRPSFLREAFPEQPSGWSWLASGATDFLSTLKEEVSTVAVGVSKAMKETVKEVREDIQEIGQDIRSILVDDTEIRKDSNKCLVAIKRLNLIDKRISQLNALVDDFTAFRSILATKHRHLKTFLTKKKIGGQVIVNACLDLSKSVDKIDCRQGEEDKMLDVKIVSPLGVVVERIQICRDLFTRYQDKKQEYEQVHRRCMKSIQSNSSPENVAINQKTIGVANKELDTTENDFIDSVKSLQKFIETHVSEKFHSAAQDLLLTDKSVINESSEETDVELMNALEAESSVEGTLETGTESKDQSLP